MSNETNAPTENTTNATATPKSERKPRQTKSSFSVQDLAKARLRKRGVKSDERLSDECKVVRGILRSNFEFVRKNDTNVKKAKDAHNDRKPWPTNMNKHTFEVAVNNKRAKS